MSREVESQYAVPAELLEAAEGQGDVMIFRGQWDGEGVFFYQAYNDAIADFALSNQKFGGEAWKPTRMTWIKPSFGWMLYRSGYASKPGQTRVLRIKLSHAAVAEILGRCRLSIHGDSERSLQAPSMARSKGQASGKNKGMESEGGGQSNAPASGRVQWDPERDLMSSEGREPRRMLCTRAIQIGMSGSLSQFYVDNILKIEDVSDLAWEVGSAHRAKWGNETMEWMSKLRGQCRLPEERPYMPACLEADLQRLGMLPGKAGAALSRLGRGKASGP